MCAFDYDGTLAPIADHPDAARMRHRTRGLLRKVAQLYPCVVISGRARRDLIAELGDVAVSRLIGNHGAETETARHRYARVKRWTEILHRELRELPGVWVEDKGPSLAVHYRQSPKRTAARDQICAAAGRLRGARILGGKEVVNIVMKESPNKGDALVAERERLRCEWVLYIGDDENDEDAFAVRGNVVPVRIGRKRDSRAEYFLKSQGEVDELLKCLAAQRIQWAS